jgi:hypothetical protein
LERWKQGQTNSVLVDSKFRTLILKSSSSNGLCLGYKNTHKNTTFILNENLTLMFMGPF